MLRAACFPSSENLQSTFAPAACHVSTLFNYYRPCLNKELLAKHIFPLLPTALSLLKVENARESIKRIENQRQRQISLVGTKVPTDLEQFFLSKIDAEVSMFPTAFCERDTFKRSKRVSPRLDSPMRLAISTRKGRNAAASSGASRDYREEWTRS